MDRRGMTLLEIVVSMLILSFVTLGIANVFIASKRHIGINRSKMVAIGLARYYMDGLQVNVTQDNWGQPGNYLYLPAAPGYRVYPEFNNTINPNMNYTIRRQVNYATDPALNNNVRRVKLNITWNEPQT